MNILPKKRWHVRTKDNIARVRRDEALAAEEEKKKQLRIHAAERERRREELRQRARERTGIQTPQNSPEGSETNASSLKHVNLFYELEQDEVVSDKTNKEYIEEKKLEKEKYEKQIGYLTYLGQDTNEITGNVSWYNKPREELHSEQKEISKKQKAFEDPLEGIRKYFGCEGIQKIKNAAVKSEQKVKAELRYDNSDDVGRKKPKKKCKKHKRKKHKRKNSSSECEESEVEIKRPSNVDLERLRAERIRREREERKRADELFARLNGVTVKQEKEVAETNQKYNSQFNPHLAKQNNICR